MNGVNKLGSYINRLMATVLDKESDEFVKNLALDELKRLNIDINEFVLKNGIKNDVPNDNLKKPNKSNKKLLQEDK